MRGWKTIAAAALVVGVVGTSAVMGADAASPRPQGIVAASQAETFVSITPTRVLDTRGGNTGGPIGVSVVRPLQPGQTLDLPMTGAGSPVPAGATAVVLNTTIDLDATDRSFITIYPTGQPRPNASTNNALPGSEVSNLTIARLGTGGSISIYNLKGQLNLVLDVVGYLVPLSSVDGIAGGGNTILNGTGAPANTLGNNGDYYIDNTTHSLYGPKANGAWPTPPTSLVGQSGPTIATLGTFNNATPALAIGDTPIPFPIINDTRAGSTTDIGHPTAASFVLAAGTYHVDYRVSVAANVLAINGGLRLQVNGSPVGATSSIASAATVGASASDSVVITVPAGASLQLVNSNVTATTLNSASIVIERIA